ncbi:MAG: NfeD family protein [Bacteroidota bacterium]
MSFFNLFGKSSSEEETNSSGFEGLERMKGRIARTLTPLKTVGYILVEDTRYEAVSITGFVPEGEIVRITGQNMGILMVEAILD